MHYSGILVRSLPTQLPRCAEQIASCDGAEVFLTYPSLSSLVAVLETTTLEEQEALLRSIQDLPWVAAADLVFHHFDQLPDEEPVS